MLFRFFTIPVHGGEDAVTKFNRFLATNRILAVDRQFVVDGANSTWAICVSFDENGTASASRLPSPKRGKVDFKELLSPQEFARLRALRKEQADAEAVPAYAIFTNDQLAEMIQRRVCTAAALGENPRRRRGPGRKIR